MTRHRKYFTEEERKQAKRDKNKRFRDKNPEYYTEWRKNNPDYGANYYQENREEIRVRQAEYRSTPYGRAIHLLTSYKRNDKKYKRGECTLTAEWIVKYIFSQPCAHCGETDWHKLGCNRLDNNLPHTPDNVEPCCWECNDKLGKDESKKEVYQYTKDGELVRVWESVNECGRNGFDRRHVWECCNGKRKTHKGFIWRYANENG